MFMAVAPLLARAAASKVDFTRDVRPILADKCFACHGPDGQKVKGGLRLDSREGALRPAKSGEAAVVPGHPERSELVRRVLTGDEDDLMPPPSSHKMLPMGERELLRRWIAEGAEYAVHWAYVPPLKPAVPPGENGVDYLVRVRLRQLGLKPVPEADRRTLARRLHADSRDEIAFLDSVSIALDAVMGYAARLAGYCDAEADRWSDPIRTAELRQMVIERAAAIVRQYDQV